MVGIPYGISNSERHKNYRKRGTQMKRVYALYRVSTSKQVDIVKDDIPMQRIACQEFAERQGWFIKNEFEEKGHFRL